MSTSRDERTSDESRVRSRSGKRVPRIAVATTGGDAPGMNACIRSIVKAARGRAEIVGVRDGGLGLARDRDDPPDFIPLGADDVNSIIDRAGTMLGTARADEIGELLGIDPDNPAFFDQCAKLAIPALDAHGIDGMIFLGGDGASEASLHHFRLNHSLRPIVVVPVSIDNDVAHTATTLGFDSAVTEAMQSVDKIRETATALHRVFVVEVMGRDHGEIAAHVALASGAEMVLVPEHGPYTIDEIDAMARTLAEISLRPEHSAIVVVAEATHLPPLPGEPVRAERRATSGSMGYHLELLLRDAWKRQGVNLGDVRTMVLGHLQRGAKPTAETRTLATRAGIAALDDVVASVHHLWRTGSPLHSAPRLVCIGADRRLSFHAIGAVTRRRSKREVMALVREADRLHARPFS